MPLKLHTDTKRARIVHQIVGPVQRLQVRQVPTDWVLYSTDKGADLRRSDRELTRLALRQGYVVDEEYAMEDWRPITETMMRS